MTRGSGKPCPAQAVASASRYRASVGPRYASIAVVEARSYSRNSGATSCEATTSRPEQPAPQLGDELLLVARVPEREEEADRNRLGVDLVQRSEVERTKHALGPDRAR